MIASFYLEGRFGFIKPYNPSRFIEVHVPRQESVQLSIGVIEILILHEFFLCCFLKKMRFPFRTAFWPCDLFLFLFYDLPGKGGNAEKRINSGLYQVYKYTNRQ